MCSGTAAVLFSFGASSRQASKRWPGFEATDPALLSSRAVRGAPGDKNPPIKPFLDLASFARGLADFPTRIKLLCSKVSAPCLDLNERYYACSSGSRR